jgi:uncharacterized protein YbjT (DUF2867 family)
MRIVIIGGTGLIGKIVAGKLTHIGHTVIVASPTTGVNSVTGEGVAEAMNGTDIVIDLSNSPSFEEGPVLDFFETSGRNLLEAEKNAGVKHHLAVSIVGVDRMLDLGYMRAKKVQEDLIIQSGIPYTIIRSTQFFEFLPTIAFVGTRGDEVHVSSNAFQPIAAEDVASFVVEFALSEPKNLTPEIAGPDRFAQSEFVAAYLQKTGSSATVIANNNEEYFGANIPEKGLVPLGDVKLGAIHLQQWLSQLPS